MLSCLRFRLGRQYDAEFEHTGDVMLAAACATTATPSGSAPISSPGGSLKDAADGDSRLARSERPSRRSTCA
jgi:hypothetical protein